jgi:hypothetical protein
VDAEIGEVLRDNLKRISKNRQCNGQKTKGQKRQITIYKTLLRKERLSHLNLNSKPGIDSDAPES